MRPCSTMTLAPTMGSGFTQSMTLALVNTTRIPTSRLAWRLALVYVRFDVAHEPLHGLHHARYAGLPGQVKRQVLAAQRLRPLDVSGDLRGRALESRSSTT